MLRKGNYKNDEEVDGISFYPNGKVSWKYNGFQDGFLFEKFDEDGNLIKTQEWKDGKLIPFKKT